MLATQLRAVDFLDRWQETRLSVPTSARKGTPFVIQLQKHDPETISLSPAQSPKVALSSSPAQKADRSPNALFHPMYYVQAWPEARLETQAQPKYSFGLWNEAHA